MLRALKAVPELVAEAQWVISVKLSTVQRPLLVELWMLPAMPLRLLATKPKTLVKP
jgi:hypothetical protein